MKNQKGFSLTKLLIIIVLIIGFIFISSDSKPGYELSVSNREEIAIAGLRLAIIQSSLDGSGAMTHDDFNTLGKIVKNANSSNQWFGSYNVIYYGKTADTSDKQVTIVSDGNYVATFTTIEQQEGKSFSDKKTYLVDYTFEQKSFQGYKFLVDDNVVSSSTSY